MANLGDHEHLISSMSLATCCITKLASCVAARACLPSKSKNVGRFSYRLDRPLRTVNDDLDLFINASHFVTYVLRRFSRLLAV